MIICLNLVKMILVLIYTFKISSDNDNNTHEVKLRSKRDLHRAIEISIKILENTIECSPYIDELNSILD